MTINDLITIIRNDYLDDATGVQLWDDDFMFRSFTEAERQVCNRQNILFDDTTTSLTEISLIDGVSGYTLSSKVTLIEYASLDNNIVQHLSKHEIDRTDPAWRTKTGIKGVVVKYIMRGHKLRLIKTPDASKDATFIQDSAPTSGMANDDTWYDTTNNLLYLFDGAAWNVDATATLGTLKLEIFRLPLVPLDSLSLAPEIPEEYHRDLIYWVLHEAYKKQDADIFNQERSDYFLSRFTEAFGEYIPAELRLNQMQQRSSLHLRPTAYTTRLTQATNNDDW